MFLPQNLQGRRGLSVAFQILQFLQVGPCHIQGISWKNDIFVNKHLIKIWI